jgi:hypothetical protein
VIAVYVLISDIRNEGAIVTVIILSLPIVIFGFILLVLTKADKNPPKTVTTKNVIEKQSIQTTSDNVFRYIDNLYVSFMQGRLVKINIKLENGRYENILNEEYSSFKRLRIESDCMFLDYTKKEQEVSVKLPLSLKVVFDEIFPNLNRRLYTFKPNEDKKTSNLSNQSISNNDSKIDNHQDVIDQSEISMKISTLSSDYMNGKITYEDYIAQRDALLKNS